VKSFARRLPAGTDLRRGIEEMVKHYNIAAGAVMGATGVLSSIRVLTTGRDIYSADGSFIITSVSGTAAIDKINLKLSVTMQNGDTLTGEMLEGCFVADSVEFIVGAIEQIDVRR
jgi:predicted DNA-binding protein with PD1-like motif